MVENIWRNPEFVFENAVLVSLFKAIRIEYFFTQNKWVSLV